jgi:hypothetical protein
MKLFGLDIRGPKEVAEDEKILKKLKKDLKAEMYTNKRLRIELKNITEYAMNLKEEYYGIKRDNEES